MVVQVGNGGLADIPAGVPVSLYTEDQGVRVLLQTVWTDSVIQVGRSNPGIPVELSPEDVIDGRRWIVVDDDGESATLQNECNESNDELLVEGLCQ